MISDEDVIRADSDCFLLRHIAKLVNEGFYSDEGSIRGIPLTIGGCNYIPPIPMEFSVKERINEITISADGVDAAIGLCLYVMRTQVYINGNKRAAVIFANHYMTADMASSD